MRSATGSEVGTPYSQLYLGYMYVGFRYGQAVFILDSSNFTDPNMYKTAVTSRLFIQDHINLASCSLPNSTLIWLPFLIYCWWGDSKISLSHNIMSVWTQLSYLDTALPISPDSIFAGVKLSGVNRSSLKTLSLSQQWRSRWKPLVSS